MKIIKPFILLAAVIATTLSVNAQNNTMTPYSRFGYGVLNDYATSAQRSMGGVGYAMNNSRQINPMNPASYAAIDSLTFLFDVGVDIKQLRTTEGSEKGKNFGGGLDYITMQFPVTKYMGMSIGLLPWAQVGYSFGDEIVNGEASHQGSGGINELYVGISGKLFKGFTVGANIGYLFGTQLNDTYLSPSSGSMSLFERVMEIRDYNLRFGAQYSFNIGSKHRVTLGAVYAPAKDFHGKTYGVYYDINKDVDTNGAAKPDTIGYTRLKGNYSAPATYGAGINYEWNNRLMVEADFTYQPWKDAKFKGIKGFVGGNGSTGQGGYEVDDKPIFDNRWKASLGLQYTPDSRGGYLKRVNYRLGGFYNHDYIIVGNNNNVKEYGLSLGFGLPAPVNRLTKTVVNLGFEYRHRQSSPAALVKENYFQITLGINFNELWFWQNKIQ